MWPPGLLLRRQQYCDESLHEERTIGFPRKESMEGALCGANRDREQRGVMEAAAFTTKVDGKRQKGRDLSTPKRLTSVSRIPQQQFRVLPRA